MEDKKEFIAAKDLPATEAEEVDVLCVDPTTGEMVRKPGVSLGGGEEYDLVVHFNVDTGDDSAEVVSGSYQAVLDKFTSGSYPNVLIYGIAEMGYCSDHPLVALMEDYAVMIPLQLGVFASGNHIIEVFPDGTASV